ncbi:MAG: hypothetical protein CMM52_05320 [Rhodospirillaceae bacterium]|nr:hypothetical protein [Rhodospirillaceae bacterium]|tara:strand:+ start:42461 stop:43390 length:930 start_codon:yes stop_codon:yes gene_type:complete
MVDRRTVLSGLGAGAVSLATSWPRSMSWASSGSAKGQLRFAFFTDVHARTEWETPVALAKAAKSINTQKPDLVIAGGDLITDGFTSLPEEVTPRWDTYMKNLHNAIEGDVHPTIGNHDLVAANPADGSKPSSDPRAEFRKRMKLDRTFYTFDAMGYRIFILDSIYVIRGKLQYQGLIGPEQMNWLREELSKTPNDMPIVLVSHIPLLTAFYAATRGALEGGKPNRVMVNNRGVLDQFRDHNLLLVLQGHLHAQEVIRWRNTTFITGGALCAKWWRGSWYGTEEGFNVITLRENHVDWKYVDYGWEAKRP